MQKRYLLYALLSLVLAASASAFDGDKDNWKTGADCIAAFKAGTARFYYPDIKKDYPLATGEYRAGHPTGGCADMDLPDRFAGRGWVGIGSDRELVYDPDDKIRRLYECNNKIYDFIPFSAPRDGVDGRTPTVRVGTVTEGDIASVTNSGSDTDVVLDFVIPRGKDGKPCRIEEMKDGSKVIMCPDGSYVEVHANASGWKEVGEKLYKYRYRIAGTALAIKFLWWLLCL